jgi:hypothetical protein
VRFLKTALNTALKARLSAAAQATHPRLASSSATPARSPASRAVAPAWGLLPGCTTCRPAPAFQ